MSDAADISRIERAYIDCPWTEEQIRAEISSSAIFLAAAVDGKLAGYVSGVVAADECEIANVAVDGGYRRRGIATRLLEELVNEAVSLGADKMFLSVRVDNLPAIELYKKLGFETVGVRRGYYGVGADANTMRKII